MRSRVWRYYTPNFPRRPREPRARRARGKARAEGSAAYVSARGLGERAAIPAACRGEAGRLLPPRRVIREPAFPGRPPRALVQRRGLQPLLGGECGAAVLPGEQTVAAPRVHRTADDTGIVAAAR